MSNEQIAHDLAVAKLYGSELLAKELINQYHQYYNEILSAMDSDKSRIRPAQVVKSPI